MPELAEVEFHRRRWDPGLGQRVRSAELHPRKRVFRGADVAELSGRLRGAKLLNSDAHGKQMLFRFTHDAWVGVHLGMTGELRCEGADFVPTKHDHLVLRQRKQCLVFGDARQFGRVRFHHGAEAPAWWTSLPPQIMSPGFTSELVGEFLKRRAGSPIKAVLLMQECFPGIGNWMADEILWRMRLHPATKAGQVVRQSGCVWREVRWVTAGALRIVAKDYSDPPMSWLFRHRWKDGGKCPRDGAELRRAEVGGRTSAWCPECQPR